MPRHRFPVLLFLACTVAVSTGHARQPPPPDLPAAQQRHAAAPTEENTIWLGRRTAYLGRYEEAIAIYTTGLQRFPDSYRLYRHRGHRQISLRRFDAAIADFTRAAELMRGRPPEIEPDGIPNRLNRPLSTTQFNVWYHLGLAHYLKGEFAAAERAYLECLAASDNADSVTATVDWLYMAYRRQGKHDAAAALLGRITPEMTVVENDAYLKRLRFYQGQLSAEALLASTGTGEDADLTLATQGYGVANWYLVNGETARAIELFERVAASPHRSAFGTIAAEADLARLRKR
jgi:tetratricopeptide (TPR) repeat protein